MRLQRGATTVASGTVTTTGKTGFVVGAMGTAASSRAITIHRDMITTGGADAVGIQVANNTNAATIVSNS